MAVKKVFIYDDTLKPIEKRQCRKYVAELGGLSKICSTYVSEATHVVVQDTNNLRLISPMVLGCLASGKHVVTIRYLIESHKRGSFQNELLHSDESVRKIQRNVEKYGKSFRNLTCLVFMSNSEKKIELQRILRDGGAKVPDWTVRDLSSKPTVEITNVNKIFTEMNIVSDPDFRTFIATKNRAQWRIDILHHLYIFRFIRTEPSSRERSQIDQYFDVNNKEAMKSLHDAMLKYRRKEQFRAFEEKRINEIRVKSSSNGPSPTVKSTPLGNVILSHDIRSKRKYDSNSEGMKEYKRLRQNIVSDVTRESVLCNSYTSEEMSSIDNADYLSKEIEVLKLKKDNHGMLQLRIDNIPQFKIKREIKQETIEKKPEIITLDDSFEDEIKVVQVVTKTPLSIRRVRTTTIKTESDSLEPESDKSTIKLSSKPSEIEVKRKIALEDDGIRNIVHKLRRQNQCITSTFTNPVAPPSIRDFKTEMPLVLPPGISQYKNGVKVHDGSTSTCELIDLEDSDDEIQHPATKISSKHEYPLNGIKSSTSQRQKTEFKRNNHDVIVISDDEDGINEDSHTITASILTASEGKKQINRIIDEPRNDEIKFMKDKCQLISFQRAQNENVQLGSLKLRSMKDLTGVSSPRLDKNKVADHDAKSMPCPDIQNDTDSTNKKGNIEKHIKKESALLHSEKTWGLPNDRYIEIEKQIWASDDEDEILFVQNSKDVKSQDSSISMSKSLQSTENTNPEMMVNTSEGKCIIHNQTLEKVAIEIDTPIKNIPSYSDITSKCSASMDSEMTLDENELNDCTTDKLDSTNVVSVAEKEIPKSLEKHDIVDNISPYFLRTILSDSNAINTIDNASSVQFDSQNLDVDVKKCIKSLIIRQKLTNECIDIDNIRARTPKFDSKKESKLSVDELDVKGRPRSDPFGNYLTTQLFETTFNCTELVGLPELLDTIQALSSATCSKYFARAKTNNKMLITNFLTENEATAIYSDEEVESKQELEYCLVNRTKEYFENFVFLHPPINNYSRREYINMFQPDFDSGSRSPSTSNSLWQFVSWLVELYDKRHEMKNIYQVEVLKIVIDVLQKDLDFWCKHSKRNDTKDNTPLIKFLFDVENGSYNEENVQVIIRHLLHEIKIKGKPTMFRKALSMLAIYCGRIDAMKSCASIAKTPSLKSKLALQIFRAFKKSSLLTPNQIYAQFYLLRPQWLSMMGISAILCDMTGIPLQNLSSVKNLDAKFYLKEIVALEESDSELMNDTDLHIACRKMDVDKVRKILDRTYTNINAVNASGRSALHIAAMRDSRECIEILIDHRKKGILRFVVSKFKTETDNVDLYLKDINGDCPLTIAVKYNSTEATNLILSKIKSTSQIDRVNWNEAWSNCKSTKMYQILLKHFQSIDDMSEENISSLCNNISKDKIILKLPNVFNNLLSLLIDKLFATFPSPIVLLAKLIQNKSKLAFKHMKLKDNSSADINSHPRLDSGIDISITTLIDDVSYQMDLKKNGNCVSTYDVNSAHEFVRHIVKRKLPVF